MALLKLQLFLDVSAQIGDSDNLLLHGVAVADGDVAGRLSVKVHTDGVGRADFVLAAISLADGSGFIIINREVLDEKGQCSL